MSDTPPAEGSDGSDDRTRADGGLEAASKTDADGTDAARTDTNRADAIRSWPDAWGPRSTLVVLVLVTAAFGATAGLPGVAIGVALTLGWFVLPAVALFAVGTVAHTALLPPDAGLFSTLLPLVPLAGLLFVTTLSADQRRDWTTIGVAWLGLGGLVAVAWVLTETVWVAGLALAVVGFAGFVSVAYFGLQRVGTTDE